MRDALREAAFGFGRPVGHRASGGWKGRALSEAEHDAREQHRAQGADQAGKQGGARPDDRGNREGQAGSKTVAEPAANNLKN